MGAWDDPYTIGEVLSDVAGALGTAAKTLVETSATHIGTLAVKTAELTVDFDIMATKTGDNAETGVHIRPGTLAVSNDQEHTEVRWSNHSTLRLQIVSVLPDVAPDAVQPIPAPMPTPGPGLPAGTLISAIGGLTIDSSALLPLLGLVVDELTERMRDRVKLPPDRAKNAAAELAEMRSLIDHSEPERAQKSLVAFARSYPEFGLPQG